MVATVTREWIAEQRDYAYRRTPNLRIQTPEGALAFVDEVGFCHFWPTKGAEIPNLFQAIAGRIRSVPMRHDDPDISRCWSWKDAALDKRQWYYGKLLRRRATLVSLELLPVFYACSENTGDLEDYLDEYRAGMMTAEAKWIYEALLEHGPLDTIRLRREAGMSATSAKSRFDRALVELQVGLKVIPVGVARTGAWRYAFTYEILQRHIPELPKQAAAIKRSEARRMLVSRYLDDVIAADREMINRIFHVMRWTSTEVQRTIGALLNEEVIREAEVDGLDHPQLISTHALERNQ
ncbi:MAG: hypothetical protein GTO63_09210 [Anaerolineae bacterium]|nr:hypothetical protein [Anaerolineae bacterium]NIN95066.1 hypothetical protein [Anaerolineae bacterium]NIQ78105.1 hypothetical protein [Anaerolineae bacterium]